MGKLLMFVLGLCVIAGVVWWALRGTEQTMASSTAAASQPEVPTKQLDNVRQASKRIEQDDQRRLDDTMQKATEP